MADEQTSCGRCDARALVAAERDDRPGWRLPPPTCTVPWSRRPVVTGRGLGGPGRPTVDHRSLLARPATRRWSSSGRSDRVATRALHTEEGAGGSRQPSENDHE